MEPKKQEKKGLLYDIYALVHDLVHILAVVTLIFVFCVRLVGVKGDSMLPTLEDGDYLALQSNVIMGDLECGDIIVARSLDFKGGEPLVKRVIATEGQEVFIDYQSGSVLVDGIPLEEDYIMPERLSQPLYNHVPMPLTVDEGCVFVMGDNRNDSADSRYVLIDQIPVDQVLGKVLFLIFPGNDGGERDFGRIGTVK